MKLNVAAILLLGFLIVSGNAFAQSGPGGDAVSVSASETGFFTPDTAELTFAVETDQKTAEMAARENAGKAASLVKTLKALVNEKAGESIRTRGYSVQPVYEKLNTLAGYRATNEVTVKIHKLDGVCEIIDRGLSAGANRIESLDFMIEDEAADCGKVIAGAGEKARKEARALASSLGIRLGKVKSASTSCSASGPVFMGGEMLSAKAEKTATPVEIGQTRLNASVNVAFHLK